MLEVEFKVLKSLNDDNSLNQRNLAKEVDVSLGKVNSILKSFTKLGYINRENEDNSIKYVVTEMGLNELNLKLNQDKNTRLNIHQEYDYKLTQAVILAAGKREDFDKPVGMLEIEDFILIDRTVKILRDNKINKIIIIGGYKSDILEEHFKDEKDIVIVNNKDYIWTGTMYSLACAEGVIEDDFLLLESDLVFEHTAVTKLCNYSERDCILLTKESGSEDEAFVEIRDECLFKISKDIHQLNSIDGEIVGITKISFKLYKMMLDEFSCNKNPYINYEYTLLDVARNYNIGYIRIDDLVWGEIDSKNQYNQIKKSIFPKIRRKYILENK
ncbi:MAG: winged helix-turn-helix transcriptional regulator [Clostridium sp.]